MKERREVGRPRIVETPEEFDRLVEEFRVACEASGRPITFTGMAQHLGFASRQSFYAYEKRPEFSYSVKRARLLVERTYEERLSSDRGQVAGAIFALKNHGWSDRHELTGAHGGPLHTEEVSAARDRLARRIDRIAARISSDGSSDQRSTQ